MIKLYFLFIAFFPIPLIGQIAHLNFFKEEIEVVLTYKEKKVLKWAKKNPHYELQVHSDGKIYRFLSRGMINSIYSDGSSSDNGEPNLIFKDKTTSSSFARLGFVDKVVESGKKKVVVRNARSKKLLHFWLHEAAKNEKITIKIIFKDSERSIELPVEIRKRV